ncbi:MAG: hypothetical protein E7632_06910 [Ruminococcaceae bacterium]|nr:hypothetical protein [Oscillospiraceae bacterium]
MTKNEKIRTGIVVGIVLIAIAAVLSRVVVFDHSARRTGDGFEWRGVRYVTTGGTYQGGRTVAKTDDNFAIVSVKGDAGKNFYVLSSFLDSELCVREGYTLPTDGEIRAVSVNHMIVSRRAVVDAIARGAEAFTPEGQAEMRFHADSQTVLMKELSFFYGENPVSTDPHKLEFGTVDGRFVLARKLSSVETEDNVIFTYEIWHFPPEDAAVLAEYFK